MKTNISLLTIIITLIFFMSCNETTKNKKENTADNQTARLKNKGAKKDCDNAHWSHHKGPDGPENWKNICTGFATCGGNSQSPININTKKLISGTELESPKFNYYKSKVNIINNSHTVQFNIDKGNKINLNGKNYELLQFHYHALSEHTVDGKHFPLEVHFVHKHSDSDYAVLGVMIVEGKENALFKKYLDKFPTSKGEYKSDEMIDLLSLLPKNKSYYYYNGSLTTPPCTEVVSWYVLEKQIEASAEQIEKFSTILNNNYRPVMPLNNREVKIYKE
ncbi:MAG: carbonic anhydrase family protein [Chlorobi bacterium]|nr:carbonic anhydrase family protein [Chlorobiota bacterium]